MKIYVLLFAVLFTMGANAGFSKEIKKELTRTCSFWSMCGDREEDKEALTALAFEEAKASFKNCDMGIILENSEFSDTLIILPPNQVYTLYGTFTFDCRFQW